MAALVNAHSGPSRPTLSDQLDGVVAMWSSSLNVESEELVGYRSELVRQIQAHKKYQQYMGRVLEIAGDFHEMSEIMSRYQTLLATHEVPPLY